MLATTFADYALECFDDPEPLRIGNRVWQLTVPRLREGREFIQGRLGYRLPPDKHKLPYNREEREFVPSRQTQSLYEHVHYVVDVRKKMIVAETRKTHGITHKSLRYVFEQLLNINLHGRLYRVSLVPEPGAFREWLKEVNLVTHASLTVHYPNPHIDEYHEFARDLLELTGARNSNVQWRAQNGLDASEDSLLDNLSDFVANNPDYTVLSAESDEGYGFRSGDNAMNRPLDTDEDEPRHRIIARMVELYRDIFGNHKDE